MKKTNKCKVSPDIQIFGSVVVGSKGQIVIPNEVRKLLSLESGDSMLVVVKHGKAIGLIKSTDFSSFVDIMQEEISNMKKMIS